jgi:hypothetical protein
LAFLLAKSFRFGTVADMNALEKFRRAKKLTYDELAVLAGGAKASVWRHCSADRIPGEASFVYHRTLGIPLSELRPDLYGDKRPRPDGEQQEAA